MIMAGVAIRIRLELRDLPRLKQLVWELRQLEHDLRLAGLPEAETLTRILDRYFADVAADEPEEPPV